MKKSEIVIGQEYKVGTDSYSSRARVVEVGTYEADVYSKDSYRPHKATKHGAKVEWLKNDGERVTKRTCVGVDCEACLGTGQITTSVPSVDFSDVFFDEERPCDACEAGKVRVITDGPKPAEWVDLPKVRCSWTDAEAARQQRSQNEARLAEFKRAAEVAAANLGAALAAAGIKAKAEITQGHYAAVTVTLSATEAVALTWLLADAAVGRHSDQATA